MDIEQVMAEIEKHEAIEDYDGIVECLCAKWYRGKDDQWSYDRHLQTAVREALTEAK